MSQSLDNDQEVLQGRRRKKLKGVDASLRDQVVSDLVNTLEDEDFGQQVVEAWHVENSHRQPWLERQQTYLQNWDNFIPNNSEGAFEGSSDLHLPVAFTVAKTFHARMMQAILGVDPPFSLRPRRADSEDAARMLEPFLNYTLKEWVNDRKGIDEAIDTWIWDFVTTGVGIMKTSWDVKFDKFVDVVEREEEGVSQETIDENGNSVFIPTTRTVEEEVEKTIERFRGPFVDHIRPEDFILVNGEGDPDRADMVLHRQFLTASELWTLADRKIFREDVVRKVIDAGENHESTSLAGDIKQQRAQNAGMTDNEQTTDHARYEILETYVSKDVDGSGINTEIIVWVHTQTKEILKATYLRRVNKAGKRPFAKADFYRRPGEQYGMGLIEILHPLTTEMDAMHNMRIDWGMIGTMPFGFYRPSSNIDPETLDLKPGALIPVDDPQNDVFFPNLGNRTAFGVQEEQALQTMIERLTGISDLALGVLSSEQGVARTATGARALISESNTNLNVILRRLNFSWRRVLENLMHMLQQRTPPGFEFRVTGEDGNSYFSRINERGEIQGDFDIMLSENSANSNKQIQQEKAQQILSLTSNPLDIQLGIVGPGNRFEAAKNFLQSFDVEDWSRYITKPQNHTEQMSPEEEFNRVARGIEVDVGPRMDHQGFLDFWEDVKNNDEMLGQFDEAATVRLERQALKHQAIQQALQAAAAEQRERKQAQANQAAGPTQAASQTREAPQTGQQSE